MHDIELKIDEIKSHLKSIQLKLDLFKWAPPSDPCQLVTLTRMYKHHSHDLEILIKAQSIVNLTRRKKYWRDNILLRDNFTCLRCNSRSDLTIHHLIPKSKCDPSMYYAEYNGLVLCERCHREWHDNHDASDCMGEFLRWLGNYTE